jgi:hypothetical protein
MLAGLGEAGEAHLHRNASMAAGPEQVVGEAQGMDGGTESCPGDGDCPHVASAWFDPT